MNAPNGQWHLFRSPVNNSKTKRLTAQSWFEALPLRRSETPKTFTSYVLYDLRVVSSWRPLAMERTKCALYDCFWKSKNAKYLSIASQCTGQFSADHPVPRKMYTAFRCVQFVHRESIDLRSWQRDNGGNNYVYGWRCDLKPSVCARYTHYTTYAYVSNRVSEWSILCRFDSTVAVLYFKRFTVVCVLFSIFFLFFFHLIFTVHVRPLNRTLILFDIHQNVDAIRRSPQCMRSVTHYVRISPTRSLHGPSESRRSSSTHILPSMRSVSEIAVSGKAYLNYKMKITSKLYCSTLTSE